MTLSGNAYTFSYGYNDSGAPTSLTYSDGEQLSYGYDSASDWLTSLVTTPSGGSATNLLPPSPTVERVRSTRLQDGPQRQRLY